MLRGTVIRVDLPQPKGQPGHEQFGVRPAVVIQDETFGANLSTVVVVPLTGNLNATKFAGSFIVDPTKENGLTVQSVALTNQVRSIDNRRVKETIGRLSQERLAQLESALRKLIAL